MSTVRRGRLRAARAHPGVVLALWVPLLSCRAPAEPSSAPAAGASIPLVLGEFEDDYGSRHSISNSRWVHQPDTRYEIVAWNPQEQYLVARNHVDNPADGGRWTRIDWVALTGMEPFTWAFCLSAYDAPTRAEAEASNVARRNDPRTGCNGFPFSRMARLEPAP